MSSQRIEPTFGESSETDVTRDAPAAAEDKTQAEARVKRVIDADPTKFVAVRFDDIRAVVKLARRAALEDLEAHQVAFMNAESPEAREEAAQALVASREAAKQADGMYRSFISSETDFRGATVDMMMGKTEAAQHHAERSSFHLSEVANRLDSFAAYAPKSRFFGATLAALARADHHAGRLESHAVKKVDDFAEGLKSFATRVRAFGRTVAALPARVSEVAKETGKSVASSAMSFGARMMSRVRAGVSTAGKVAAVGAATAVVSAWVVLDESFDLAKRGYKAVDDFAEGVVAAIDQKVDQVAGSALSHTISTVGVAGSILSNAASNVANTVATAGKAIAKDYGERYDAAQKEIATKRVRRAP
jgi:hypothetical protein